MSFREKSAWITLITLIVLTLFYLTHLPPAWLLDPPSGFMFHVLVVGVGAFVVIVVVAHIVIAVLAPHGTRTLARRARAAHRAQGNAHRRLRLRRVEPELDLYHPPRRERDRACLLPAVSRSRSPRPSTTLRGSSTTVAGSARDPNHDHEFDSPAALRAQRDDAAGSADVSA